MRVGGGRLLRVWEFCFFFFFPVGFLQICVFLLFEGVPWVLWGLFFLVFYCTLLVVLSI